MRRILLLLTAFLLAVPLALAFDEPKAKDDKPGTVKEQLAALTKEFNEEAKKAQSQEDVLKVAEKFVPRALDIADKNGKDPAGLDALIWVFEHGGILNDKSGDRTVELLMRDHLQSDRLAVICQACATDDSPLVEKLLPAVMEKNPKNDIKGMACYSLAAYFKSRSEAADSPEAADKKLKEAEKYFEQTSAKYADVKAGRGTLGDAAKQQLKQIKDMAAFAIGKVAPDIEGEDTDGKKFKLSDYRGKVVVLDFWGHW